MTDIEQRARDALNTLYAERHNTSPYYDAGDERLNNWVIEAMCRALEAHDATKAEFEAHKRDVSEVAKRARELIEGYVGNTDADGKRAADFLSRFILADPVDPLEVLAAEVADNEAGVFRNAYTFNPDNVAHCIALAALKRGLTITEQQP